MYVCSFYKPDGMSFHQKKHIFPDAPSERPSREIGRVGLGWGGGKWRSRMHQAKQRCEKQLLHIWRSVGA